MSRKSDFPGILWAAVIEDTSLWLWGMGRSGNGLLDTMATVAGVWELFLKRSTGMLIQL